MSTVKNKAVKNKKTEPKKLIPVSLFCSFIIAFLKESAINVDGIVTVIDVQLCDKVIELGYSTWSVNCLPTELIKKDSVHKKTATYKHYMRKFIKDFFDIEVIEIHNDEFFIDADIENENFQKIEKGLETLGFVTK